MSICCSKTKSPEKKKQKSNLLIQNQELLRLRLTHEEKVFYTQLFYDNAVGGKVLKNNFLPLLGMLGTSIAEEFAERIFLAFSSNKKDITLCEYLKYIDIYHYGDDRERCRVTCKLIDKNSTGLIKLEDFKSYINLIMSAVQKVNGGMDNSLMSDQDIRDLFYHISKDKESFTYQEFEDLYKEKPELVSWFDYFKNNKEDLLLIINQNMNNLLDLIIEFLQSFMVDIFSVMEQEQQIDISNFMQKVYFFSNELEKTRKKFLKKISKFNIRNTFDKLQNNVQNQKTMDLINTLQKKILNEDSNLNRGLTASSIQGNKKNNLSSFNTINVTQKKDFGSSISKKTNEFVHLHSIKEENNQENTGMTKFFQKIKNNLEIKNTKDKNSEQNIIDEENSSSSSSEEEDNKPNQKESSKDLIKKNSGGNKFAENFEKQRTFFQNKMFKFGNKDGGDNNINNDILEQEDEEDNELYVRQSSQNLYKDNPFYERTRNTILNNINLENNLTKATKKFDTSIMPSGMMTKEKKEERNPYDESDYDSIIQCGSIEESNLINEEEEDEKKKKSKK